MTPGWNRVVFLRFGSGVDYRAKLSFQSVDDTVFQGPPSFTTYRVLRSITMQYVMQMETYVAGQELPERLDSLVHVAGVAEQEGGQGDIEVEAVAGHEGRAVDRVADGHAALRSRRRRGPSFGCCSWMVSYGLLALA